MVYNQGQELPYHHQSMVQANAGTGEYNPAAYPMAPFGSSPDGIGVYSRVYSPPQSGATKSGVLGALANSSPLVRGLRAMSGLGDDATTTTPSSTAAPATVAPSALPSVSPAVSPGGAAAVAVASGTLVAAAFLGLALTGLGGYYVGKAVAPSSDKESKYAWWGVAAALLGGPIGLGIEAIIALDHKGR
jgi:hypothetical protein